MDARKDILWRVYLIFLFVCLFGLAIIGQVIRLQFVQGNYWKSKADSLTTAYRNIEAARGNVYAADGSLLATSVPIYEVRMDVNAEALTNEVFNKNIDSLVLALADLFKDKTEREYKRELINARRNGERYYLLQRNVSYNELKSMRTFPMFRMGRYKGGLIVAEKSRREKPFQELAKRTIGYDIDSIKPVGLEGAYSEYLKGIGGKRLMQKLSGDVWMPINDDNEIDPQDGKDIITTIDINIQDVAEHALQTQLEEHHADHGCAVLMEVATGEIKAIANLSKDSSGNYKEYYNYAIGESTEPGSTFKLASMIAAMEDGYVDLGDTVNLENGTHKYYDQTMTDSHAPEKKKVTAQRAFEVSSNVGISKLIYQSYWKNPQAFIDRICKMKLNDSLGLQIPGETSPLVKNTKDKSWSGVTLPFMSIGYEVRLTPLQILTFYNAVANNGKMVKPMFVKEIRQRGKLIKNFPTTVINEAICSQKTIDKAKKLLEGVVENGTASNLKNANYKIAGKTGTAQIANKNYGYKYNAKISYQASFVGYFPADNPKYSCIAVVYSPSNDVYYGGAVAAPIFKEIADKVYASSLELHKEYGTPLADKSVKIPFAYAGYQKDIQKVFKAVDMNSSSQNQNAEWVAAVEKDNNINLIERKNSSGVPNVVGMGLRDAIYLLENYGLHVKIKGKGIVTKQSIDAGIKVEKGSQIIIELG